MIWRTNARAFDLGTRGIIAGILNVTPDSFSDGGEHASIEAAVAHGLRMAREGADILDIGGESTRPGAVPLDTDEELRRVIPVIEQLAGRTSAALSIDTSKAAVARAALSAGAEIVNDITALRGDPRMAEVLAETGAAVILMHMQGTPQTMQVAPHYDNVTEEVVEFLRERAEAARRAGIASDRIALDPGIGFGKTVEHNLRLTSGLGILAALGFPVMLGVSRKSFLSKLAPDGGRDDRDFATAGLTALGRALGARLFRVHAVRENLRSLRAVEAVLNLPPPTRSGDCRAERQTNY